jgi:hypothetical protein
METPPEDDDSLEQLVSRAAEDVRRLEREFDVAVEERMSASSDSACGDATERAAGVSSELSNARERLSEARRTLAKAQGDTYRSDEATPTI